MESEAASKMSQILGFLSAALHTLWLEFLAEAFYSRFSAIVVVKVNNITHMTVPNFDQDGGRIDPSKS